MRSAFGFLLTRTLKNFVAWRVRRMRQPRYAAATVVGALYLWMMWGRYVFGGHHGRAVMLWQAFPVATYSEVGEVFATAGLSLTLLVAWAWPHSTASLRFSQAEIQFLFPAPVSRRALIHYKILRSQLALLMGAAIASLFLSGRIWRPSTWPFTFGAWLVLMTLNLHFLALGLLRTNLLQHGVGLGRQALYAVGAALAVAALLAFGAWQAWPAVAAQWQNGFLPVLHAARTAMGHGVLGVVLWPLRAVVRPALSPGLAEFAFRLPAAITVMALNYLWVLRSDAAFEEAAVAAAEKRAARVDSRRRGTPGTRIAVGAKRTAPFRLAPTGRPEVAILWKNLIAASRALAPRIFLRVIGIQLVVLFIVSRVGHVMVWQFVAGALAVVTGLMFVLGPNMTRSDFRMDLLQLEILKTWPMAGASIVVGELAVPVIVITAIQWLGLASLLVVLPHAGFRMFDPATRTALLLGAMLLAPGINLVGVMVQNAAVLLLPGWFSLGANRPSGMEATGQRLLTLAGSLLALAVLSVPAALAAVVAVVIGRPLMGPWSYLLAAFSAAVLYLGEAGLAMALMGRLFDGLDPSREGILSQ